VREIEGHTLTLLGWWRRRPRSRSASCCFNLLFLVVIELVTVPLFLLLMGGPPPRWGVRSRCSRSAAWRWPRPHAGGADHRPDPRPRRLFAGVSLPLLLPVLAAAVRERARSGRAVVGAERVLPRAYAAAVLGASLLLYDHLWEDLT
jgi:ABC-type transport system involved in cytochrome c biogenesis permease component